MAFSDYLEKVIQNSSRPRVQTSSANTSPQKQESSWYAGEQPTARETGAQVYRIGMENPSMQTDLNRLFEEELDNPNGPIYQPYRKATSTSFTKTNIQNTQKAQAEWAGLQDELNYWAGRSDLNLSDDEIIGRIDWKKYSTLTKMDEQAAMGTPLALVDAVGYSKDAMYGTLWAARNPGQSTGDAFMDSIQGQIGRGTQHTANEINGWRDATSGNYAPYKAGATALSDLAYKYRMDGDFDAEWLAGQGMALLNGDEQMKKDYNQIYKAVTQTDKLDAELQKYHEEVNAAIASGLDPRTVFYEGMMQEEYPELYKALEGQRSGKLVETSRALDFDFDSDVIAMQEAYQNKTGTMDDADFAADVAALLGLPTLDNTTQKVVTVQTNAQLQEAGSIFAKYFTPSEAGAMYTAGAGYTPTKQQTVQAILNGTAGDNEAYTSAMDAANQYAAEFWLNSLNTLNQLKAEKKALEKYAAFDQKWADKLAADPFNAQFDTEYMAESEAIQPYLSVAEKYNFDASQIDSAIANEEKVQANILKRFADAEKFNTTGQPAGSVMPLLTFVNEFSDYVGGARFANTTWGEALSNGESWEKVGADLNQQEKNNVQMLRIINTALRQAGEYGLNEKYTKGLLAFRDELISETELIQYDKMSGNADFESVVQNFNVPSSNNPILMVMDDPETFYRTADEQTLAYGAPVSRMTDAEKKLYKYVYATQGAEAAADYYSRLEPMLNVRMSEEAEAQAKEDADNAWFGGTVMSALANLGGAAGMFDNALKTISGQEVDPYGMNFLGQRYSQTVREEVKQNIDENFGEWADVLKLGYDVLATSLDQGAALAAGGGMAPFTLALQSGSAGNAALMDAYLSGGSNWQAWGKAGIAFAAEYLTEKGPLGNLLGAYADGGTGAFKETLKRQMIAEGLGEGISEIVNTLSDNVIMQEMSQYNALVEQYMSEGYTEELAKRMAGGDTFTNILYSGFLGAVSSAPTTTASYAAGALSKRKPNKFKSRAEAALSKAQSDGVGKSGQAAAMAAAMETGGSAPEDADAAASAMVQSDPEATYTLWSVLEHSNDFDAVPAVELGALVPDSQTGTLFEMIKQEGATDENVAQLIETANQEMANSEVKAKYDAAVAAYAEGASEMAIMMGADLSGIKNAQNAVTEKGRTLQTARTSLEAARANMNRASTVLTNAQLRFKTDHGDKATAAVIKAKERYTKAQESLESAKQTEAAAQQDYDTAKTELENIKQTTLADIRQQGVTARDQIMANRQAVQEQKAAEAEAKREADNVLSLEADNFVNTYFDTAPEDVRADIKERYMAYDGETRKVTRDMASFASQISKKFNLSITFTDSHNIFEGAYTGGNQIVLDKNATQGDVIKRVLVHEITHAAETSNTYNELADAVLGAYYGNNKKQIEADITAKSKQYAEAAGQNGADIARTELVAERLAEMLSGNQEAMDRLVAEKPDIATRIWRAIKEFIGKMTGVQNSELDKFIQLEKKLEKALGSRTNDEATKRTRYLIEYTTDNMPVVVVEENILEGVPRTKWIEKTAEVLRERFADGVPAGNNIIRVNSDSANEFTRSKYSQWLLKHQRKTFADKMRTAANADEVIKASHDYVNESPKHARKDKLDDFSRGEVTVQIGENWYDAEVVVGHDRRGWLEFYDLVDLKPIQAKEKKTSRTVEAEAPLADKSDLSRLSLAEDQTNVKHEILSDSGEPAAEIIRGGADSLPVAYDIADRFVSEYKAANPGAKFSLPSTDILNRQMAAYRESQQMETPEGMGQRQFAGQTVQNSTAVPEEYKPTFMLPENLLYTKDTNREQVERAWQRIQQNGFEAEYNRLLEKEEVYDADDTAEANLMMAMALNPNTSDPAVFMSLALRYNEKGTENAQALQARQLFKKMTPTGAQVWVAGKAEKDLKERRRTHQPEAKIVDDAAKTVADLIKDMQSGDELLRLTSGGDFTIDASNNKWGIPLNEQQKALIEQYDLSEVNRPGLFYNRATVKQRMLEAIIATPNPLEVTGLGLNLIQRLEYMKRGAAVVTNADLNYIGARLGEFIAAGEEAGDRAAKLALARAYEAYGNIKPASKMEKFRAQRYTNMLLSVPSVIRNVIGNALQNTMNAAAHGVGVEIDKLASKITGKRTIDHLTVKERADGWAAFVEETKNTFLDYYVDRVNTAPNREKYSTSNRGRVFNNGMQEGMRNLENFLMSVGDRNVWKKAFVNSLAEQQRLADQGLLFNTDGTSMTHEQMVEQAEKDANYVTFTEDNLVQDLMGYLAKRHPAIADVISVYLPFTGVPTNIVRRSLQFSPVGLAYTLGKWGVDAATHRNFDQRTFVSNLSKNLTGTGLMAAGMLLAKFGMIKLGSEDEESTKAYDAATAMGNQYTPYVYDPFTDTYVSMSTFAPALSPLVWGTAAIESLKGDEDAENALLNSLMSSTDSIFDASYLSGFSDIFGGQGSFTENLIDAGLSNITSQMVPAVITQLANATDPYVRNTKDKNKIVEALKVTASKIPYLRENLPEKVDVAGETVRTKGWWSFVDPFTRTNPSKNTALNEAYRLYEMFDSTDLLPSDSLRSRTNTLKVKGKRITLTNLDKEWYQKRYGEIWTSALEKLMNSPRYARMTDEERADALEDILSDAMNQAKKEALEKYGPDAE